MSKRFLVIAVLLIAITVAGLLTIFMVVATPMGPDAGGKYQDDGTYIATNAFVATAISSTATAKAWTATPAPTSTHQRR